MKRLVTALLLGLAPSLSYGADATSSNANVSTLLPNGIDAYISGAGGYVGSKEHTNYDVTPFVLLEDPEYKGSTFRGRATFSIPLNEQIGLQIDLSAGREKKNTDFPWADQRRDMKEIAGHLFWREQDQWLIGVIGQYGKQDFEFFGPDYSVDVKSGALGAEFQYYLQDSTLSWRLARLLERSSSDEKGRGVVVGANWKYFLASNLAISPSVDYVKSEYTANLADKSTYNGLTLGLSGEYRFDEEPISVFFSLERAKGKFKCRQTTEDTQDRFLMGVKFNLTPISLKDRDRSGASLNPLTDIDHLAGTCGVS